MDLRSGLSAEIWLGGAPAGDELHCVCDDALRYVALLLRRFVPLPLNVLQGHGIPLADTDEFP